MDSESPREAQATGATSGESEATPGGGVAAPPAEGYAAVQGVARIPARRETPGYLLDVRLTLSVEVGRVQMPVREVMELGPGSVVELNRAAGEPVEIYANGRCIGHGEIVVVGDQFGVRITELGSAA